MTNDAGPCCSFAGVPRSRELNGGSALDFGRTFKTPLRDRCQACGLGVIAQGDILGEPSMNTPHPPLPSDADAGRNRRANDHALFIVFFANGGPQHFDLSQEHLTFVVILPMRLIQADGLPALAVSRLKNNSGAAELDIADRQLGDQEWYTA